MSMDINVYFPSALTTESLPSVIHRLGELGLRCEFLEDFSFQDTGYVPITLYLAIGPKEYQEQCFETGFEIALSKFDYAKEVHAVQHPPKQGLLNKWLVGDQQEPPRKFIATREIDKVLEQCRYELSINYSKDILTPFAFAAVTAEVADGIVLECESGEYLKPQEAIQQIPELAKDWSPLE
jgi:hypothetical protein